MKDMGRDGDMRGTYGDMEDMGRHEDKKDIWGPGLGKMVGHGVGDTTRHGVLVSLVPCSDPIFLHTPVSPRCPWAAR